MAHSTCSMGMRRRRKLETEVKGQASLHQFR